MPLHLYNSLTRAKEQFHPLKEGQVSLYVCGVTVYDHCHIGHARGAVVFDVLRRYLESERYRFKVKHVRNITDVDDKIIDRARSEISNGQSSSNDLKIVSKEIAGRYETSFKTDCAQLGLLPPTDEPRATEFIPKMILFIQELLHRGIAYEAPDGVYFSVRKLSDYGPLSHQKLDQMLEGVRVEVGEGKRDPLDFALWKKAKPEEPSWDSPWGQGRPGWHIECTTMSTDILGDAFDIHGGGQDLIFPHHENERAQAVGAGKKFARYWLHNGLLTVNGQKMSKSVGNIVSIREVLEKHPNPDVLRLFFVSAHYRSPIDFTWDRYDEAAHAYERIRGFLSNADALGQTQKEDHLIADQAEGFHNWFEKFKGSFYEGLDDDLNTPEAIAGIQNFVWKGNFTLQTKVISQERAACIRIIRDHIYEWCRLFGFSLKEVEARPMIVDDLIREREKFRKEGQYAAADGIRAKLLEFGWIIEDTDGKTVVRKRV